MPHSLLDTWPSLLRRSFRRMLMGLGVLMAGCAVAQQAEAPSAETALLEKGFEPAWVAGLGERGEPRWYSGEELAFIGQPVGGLYAGQVYLGGDGRLWYWDIFNQAVIEPGSAGDKFYNEPMPPEDYRSVSSGFVLDLGDRAVMMDGRGFADVRFRGEYPISRVQMRDDAVPVSVELEAFSPFSPTQSDDSSIPATILSYTLTNTTTEPVTLRVGGWLENAADRAARRAGVLVHRAVPVEGAVGVMMSGGHLDGADARMPEIAADSGSMAFALLGAAGELLDAGALPEGWRVALDEAGDAVPADSAVLATRTMTLAANESVEVRFAVCWYFPNGHLGSLFPGEITRRSEQRNYYAKFYADAGEVAADLAQRHDALVATTRLWRDTWYDSTLPVWFLDRTFQNASTLATTAAFRMHDSGNDALDGRVYFWEGTYLGPGSCTHVTHYEQAFGRLFPDAARAQRAVTDFGVGWNDELGYVQYRAEWNVGQHFGIPHATDGHAGTILRTYREHTTSIDDAFLRSVWPRVKRATQFMIDQDAGRGFFAQHVPEHARNQEPDGILEGPQYHTLDKYWNGVIPWTSGMYLASLRATAEMARDMGDDAFADQCERIAEMGKVNLSERTFHEAFGYFVQHPEQGGEALINTNIGCHIDQMLGDYWTHQAGLEQVFPREQARTALAAIFEHNLYRRADDYREDALIKVHRFYADGDEPGTFICPFPHGGARDAVPSDGTNWDGLVAGYFSECMTGFTYQAAAHMIDEGLVLEGLALCRAIHDRYAEAPLRRNPFNEIEYGNHYTRAMSSYGAYIAASGFEYHGPREHIGFAPKLNADNFRCAFTAAEGWGTYQQGRVFTKLECRVEVKHGVLWVKTFAAELSGDYAGTTATRVSVNGQPAHGFTQDGDRVMVDLGESAELYAGETLVVEIYSDL
ncbi:MAG: GH116 family glycosyl-hydrolase [Planctomycetota bacterium]